MLDAERSLGLQPVDALWRPVGPRMLSGSPHRPISSSCAPVSNRSTVLRAVPHPGTPVVVRERFACSRRSQLSEVLLNVATVRPVFLWGAPGIGRSSLVRDFAASLGLECVSLLGTQLAAEDLIGVPQVVDGRSRFCPPEMIARDTP